MNKKDDLVYINLDEKKTEKKKMTFTKTLVSVILFVCLLDIQFVFILAFLGRTQIAETMGVCLASECIATILGYLCKAFFENREIGKNEIENKKIEYNYTDMINNSINNAQYVDFNDEPVG